MTSTDAIADAAKQNTTSGVSPSRVTIMGQPMDLMTGAQVLDWIQFAAR